MTDAGPARPAERPAILLTGVGKRYDIVSCFAALTKVVAADPNPFAPAQYAAQVRARVPLIEDPGYVEALARLCETHGVRRRPAPDRPRHRGAGTGPRRRASLPALVPVAADRAGDVRQVRGAPAPAPARAAFAAHRLAGRGGRVLSGDGQAAPRLGRPPGPPRARRLRGPLLRRLHPRADDDPVRHERTRAVDRLPRRRGRALPERDSPHDARVPRRRVDQGHGRPRPRADRARADASWRRSRVRGPCTIQVFRDPEHGLGDHRRQHPLRRRLPRARLRGPARSHLPGADRPDGRRRAPGAARRAASGPGSPSPATTGSSSSTRSSGRPAASWSAAARPSRGSESLRSPRRRLRESRGMSGDPDAGPSRAGARA